MRKVHFSAAEPKKMNGNDIDADHVRTLPPPEFSLPNDFDPQTHELWTIRVPASLCLEDLNGVKWEENTSFESAGKKYTMHSGYELENECFRLLVKEEVDSGQDVNDDGFYLRPSQIPFAKHINVIQASEVASEVQLAPRLENAKPAEVRVRRAYAPVPQRRNLKRRWSPLGAGAIQVASRSKNNDNPVGESNVKANADDSKKRKTSSTQPGHTKHTNDDITSHQSSPRAKELETKPEDNQRLSKEEKRAKKQAKKQAKKEAKKEAKKSKKAKPS